MIRVYCECFHVGFSILMPLLVVVVSKYLVSENGISILELDLKSVLGVCSFAAFLVVIVGC